MFHPKKKKKKKKKKMILYIYIFNKNIKIRRKKEAREPREIAKKAKTLKGIKAKIYSKERYKEKVQMKKLFIFYLIFIKKIKKKINAEYCVF